MNKFLKVLGAAALIAGFAPYHVSEDEKGGRKIKALLWQVTTTPNGEEGGMNLDVNFGFPKSRVEEEEADLFSDELTVNYGGAVEEEEKEIEEVETEEETVQDTEEVVEEAVEEVGQDSEEEEKNAEETEEQ